MAKRTNGEGSVYFDAIRGRWIGAISIGTKRRRVYAPTKTEAKTKLKDLQRQLDDVGTVADGNARVSDAAAKWRTRVLPGRDDAPATMAVYEWCCHVIDDHLGAKRLRTLSIDEVEAALDAMTSDRSGKAVSRSTLVKVRSVLGQVLDFAQRRGMIAGNPARAAVIGPDAARTGERKFLNVDEARTLLLVLEDERYGAMFALTRPTICQDRCSGSGNCGEVAWPHERPVGSPRSRASRCHDRGRSWLDG